MSASEKVGRGSWEVARFPEYGQVANSRFLCRVVVGDKTLTGIIDVRKREGRSRGTLLIPMKAAGSSRLATQVEGNRFWFANPDDNYAIAEELRLVFGRHYGDLQVSSLARKPDELGVQRSLAVANRFSGSAESVAAESGDTGMVGALAQHIMESLPGGWQITPEPITSR